jgi:hypothetical protein
VTENRESGSDNDHGIWTNLRGTSCACGDPKLPGKSFCRRDYFKLPNDMRSALYQRAGYVAAFRAALDYLGLDEPQAEPPPVRAAFLTRGPRAQNRKLFRDV